MDVVELQTTLHISYDSADFFVFLIFVLNARLGTFNCCGAAVVNKSASSGCVCDGRVCEEGGATRRRKPKAQEEFMSQLDFTQLDFIRPKFIRPK